MYHYHYNYYFCLRSCLYKEIVMTLNWPILENSISHWGHPSHLSKATSKYWKSLVLGEQSEGSVSVRAKKCRWVSRGALPRFKEAWRRLSLELIRCLVTACQLANLINADSQRRLQVLDIKVRTPSSCLHFPSSLCFSLLWFSCISFMFKNKGLNYKQDYENLVGQSSLWTKLARETTTQKWLLVMKSQKSYFSGAGAVG